MVSEKSTRGKIVGLIGDGVPRSVTRIAAELGLEVRSVFWTCYDLYRLGLALRSAEPVGVLSFEFAGGQVKRLREFGYVAASNGAAEVVVGVKYVKKQLVNTPTCVRSSSRSPGTIQSQVMGLLDDGKPRSIKELVQELCMSEDRVYNSVYLLYKNGAILRTEKPQAQENARRWESPPPHHLWTISRDGGKETIINGVEYVSYRKRDGKSVSQHIIEYVREHLRDRAAFTTQVRKDLEERLGVEVLQSMVMCVLSKYRRREVYLRGYQGAERMTPFEQGFAVTWLDPSPPREQSLAEVKERTDKFLQGEQTTSPLFQRVHSIFDIVTDVSLKRDIASQIFVMSELRCSRHQLELALKKTLELYPSIKRVSIFGDERGEYGYPHYYNEKVLSQEDLQAAFKAKEQYLMKVKSSDERKGHALEGVVWWSLEKLRRARFLPQRHRTEGMHPYRHTLHLIKPVRRRKKSAEIDGVWESREQAELCKDAEVTNLLEVKFSLIRRDDVEDFVDIARFSAEFGADAKHGRVIRNGIVLWMAGAAIDNKASILVANEYLTIASYASRLGIKFIPISQIDEQLQNHGWEKASVKAVCKVAKDAH